MPNYDPRIADLLEVFSENNSLTLRYISPYPVLSFSVCRIPKKTDLLSNILTALSTLSYSNPKNMSDVMDLGKRIYQLLLTDDNGCECSFASLLFENKNPLVIFCQAEIENLPLEIIFRDCFLSLKREISRGVYGLPHYDRSSVVEQEKSLLIIADPLGNSSHSYHEGIDLQANLRDGYSDRFSKINFLSKELPTLEFNSALDSYSLIHYAGHGDFQADSGSGLLMEKKKTFTSTDLGLLKSAPGFIFINACLVGRTVDNQTSLVKKLILNGVSGIIASNWIVLDEDFADFVTLFYSYLLSGKPIGESLLLTRQKDFEMNRSRWIYHQFYGNGTHRCFS